MVQLSNEHYQEHIEQQRQIALARQAILPFQCQNTKYGCQEILMTEEFVDHEKYCDYQKVHCAKIDCKTDISFLNLLSKFFQLQVYFL